MSRARFLAKRVGFALVAAYLVVSVSFLFVVATGDPRVWAVARDAGVGGNHDLGVDSGDQERAQEAVEEYKEEHNLNDPLPVRYARWMKNIVTLRWGVSSNYGGSVTGVIATALPKTLAYVLPALLLAVLVGLGVGVFAALHRGTLLDRIPLVGVYGGFGLPDYYLGLLILFVLGRDLDYGRYTEGSLLTSIVLPTVVLTSSLLAAQARYARSGSLEQVGSEFLRFVRAKGASRLRMVRHVLRNASIPLVSLFFTEALAVLVVNVYAIEEVFGIPGIGAVSLAAIKSRDIALVLGTALVFAFVGIVGNLIQDVAYAVLDPRLDAED